ncbi:alpha/beta fold hydrolase [Thalassomonas sp. M1454]|uniref:alpha/beta fold hydrolase n=1 Tax=Thalassomonas sp. M1454 TaxID=2594477 RepID=UPI00117F9A88|nr:alpha/beta fold hydrolase [Thalassomonas sp. M1454]TRX56583.1 alpha/beta fold hydrolase [Thalassomonas sp. M1454]
MSEISKPLLNFAIRGEGSPVLLIHGLFGSLENLNMVARELETSYQVISVDVRNHGSSFHHKSMDYNDLATDIFALLDHLEIEKIAVLGHSMGGKIAMQCALTSPQRIDKLIVADIAPVLYPPHHNQIIEGLLSIDLSGISNRQDADKQLAKYVSEPGVRQFLLKNLVKGEQGFFWRANINAVNEDYQNIAKGQVSSTPYLGDTLFIKGSNSTYILAEHKPTIAQLFPNSKGRIIQGTGHWLHAEKPAAFNKIVKDFLAK